MRWHLVKNKRIRTSHLGEILTHFYKLKLNGSQKIKSVLADHHAKFRIFKSSVSYQSRQVNHQVTYIRITYVHNTGKNKTHSIEPILKQ